VTGVRIPVVARNLLIVAAIAAVLTVISSVSGPVIGLLLALARIAVVAALLWWGYTIWRENRGTFGLMSDRLRWALYAAVAALAIVILTSYFWANTFATVILLFLLVGGLGYVIYRIWQESRRYYY
jgi:hypothetical protein